MTGTIDKWHIWMASVKFEESNETKERPILIMNNSAYMISAFKMTGTNRGDNFPEHRIRDWKAAGLKKETSVRLDKLLRLDESVLTTYVGKLALQDVFLIQSKLNK